MTTDPEPCEEHVWGLASVTLALPRDGGSRMEYICQRCEAISTRSPAEELAESRLLRDLGGHELV